MSRQTRRLRYRTALAILVLSALALLYLAIGPGLEGQTRVMARAGVVAATAVALLLWLTFFSGLTWRRRLQCWGALVGAALLSVALFRFEGFTGDVAPILVPRWHQASALAVDAAAERSREGDWPQFLGPRRNGQGAALALERDWETESPSQVWRRPVGAGWSGFAVVGNRAITQEQAGEQERVVAYALSSGEELWSYSAPGTFGAALAGDGPRSTPTVVEDRVYAVSSLGRLDVLDLDDGSVVWSRDVYRENDARVPEWGVSGSPLVLDEVVVLNTGAGGGRSLVAYTRDEGELAWSGGDGGVSYASPVLMELAGVRQIVMIDRESVTGHSPSDGAVLWSHPWPGVQPKVAQPVQVGENRVLVSAGYGVGSELLEIEAHEADQSPDAAEAERDSEGELERQRTYSVSALWRSPRLKAKFTNVVLHEGYVYGLDDGVLTCLDPETGARMWKRGRYGHGQVILVGDLLLVQSEDGEVVLVEASPEELRELGRFRALDRKAWNSPALAGSYLLVRNHEEAAVFELPLAG